MGHRARARRSRRAVLSRCSNACLSLVRPLELDCVGTEYFCLPSADVADLTVGIVVPALTGNGVCDRLTELMRARRGQCLEWRECAGTPRTPRKRHDRVEDIPADVVVVAAERLAGARASLNDGHPGRQVEEVEGVRPGRWECWIGSNLVLERMLDGSIGDRVPKARRCDRCATDPSAVPDRFSRRAVLCQFVEQSAC